MRKFTFTCSFGIVETVLGESQTSLTGNAVVRRKSYISGDLCVQLIHLLKTSRFVLQLRQPIYLNIHSSWFERFKYKPGSFIKISYSPIFLHPYIPSSLLGELHYAPFKKVCGYSSSHRCTKSLTSSSAVNIFPLRPSLIGRNRWKSLDARSGLQAGCGSTSQCISSNVHVVTAAVCGRAFSWRRQML